jgi:hypothetical protein
MISIFSIIVVVGIRNALGIKEMTMRKRSK